MTSKFVQTAGAVMNFTAGANITSGSVVKVGNVLGVALKDVANGAVGQIGFGVFSGIPKVSAAVIANGETLTWDVSANGGAGAFDDNLATPASGDVTGATAMAIGASGNGDTTMTVKFTGVPGTVTA